MALLTERTLSQANKLGRREELANLISLVDAKDTPFTSMAKKGSQPQQTLFRWQVDSLPEPKTTGTVDGTDVTSNDYENYVKTDTKQYRNELAAYIQIFRRTVRVSKLTQSSVTNIAGVKDELANNVAKAILMLKRDMEKTFCSDNVSQQEKTVGQTVVPYQTRGLDKWLVKAADKDTNENATIVPNEFCLPFDAGDATSTSIATGALADLSETQIQNVLTSIYKQTGQYKSYDLLAGPLLKRAFTNLVYTTKETAGTQAAPLTSSSQRNFNRDASDSSYVSSIDVFEGDFGTLRIHPSLFLKNFKVGYIIPFDMVEVRYGGNVAEVTNLPDYGGGPARLIEAVAGLCIHNPLAFGKIDLT